MNLIVKIGILCLLLLSLSCSDMKREQDKQLITKRISDSLESKESSIPKSKTNNSANIYFRASGTEPFWSLELSKEQIKLKTITDSIVTPYAESIPAMDGNVKMYTTQTESSQLNIQITQSECTNAMSGKLSPYAVSVEYKKNTEPALHKIQGCGAFITDYHLHDTWVLEKLYGENIGKANFKNDIPSIEINSSTNTFTGFAGCNRMNGKLFFENGLLRFTDIVTTRMMCDPNNKENTFLKALRSTTTYKIENNRLWLSNPSEELIIFKKID